MGAYQETYDRWQNDPEGFWGQIAGGIEWTRAPDAVLDRSRAPLFDWFPGGQMMFDLPPSGFAPLARHRVDCQVDLPGQLANRR